MHIHRRHLALGLLGLGGSRLGGAQGRVVEAYNTYEGPPFVLPERQGLAAALVRVLNDQLRPRYHFELNHLPRQRLLKIHLDPPERFDGVALFLAPAFVGDAEQQRFLWSDPLFEDRNLLVLPRDRQPAELGLDWLQSKTMVSVRGQRYAVLDPLLSEGRLKRIDVIDERSALKMVLLARADFTQMNQLMYHHLTQDLGLQDRLIGLPEPGGGSFHRRILVGKAGADLLAPLNQAIAALPCDAQWQRLARRYGFQLAPCSQRP